MQRIQQRLQDLELSALTSGSVIIELRKDEAFTA